MADELYSDRNPYEERDLFAMLERMRRQDELDAQMDRRAHHCYDKVRHHMRQA